MLECLRRNQSDIMIITYIYNDWILSLRAALDQSLPYSHLGLYEGSLDCNQDQDKSHELAQVSATKCRINSPYEEMGIKQGCRVTTRHHSQVVSRSICVPHAQMVKMPIWCSSRGGYRRKRVLGRSALALLLWLLIFHLSLCS
jgi:hypothetical protein